MRTENPRTHKHTHIKIILPLHLIVRMFKNTYLKYATISHVAYVTSTFRAQFQSD